MDPKSIEDLEQIVRRSVRPPAFYKGCFHPSDEGYAAMRVLHREGIDASVDCDTGRVTFK